MSVRFGALHDRHTCCLSSYGDSSLYLGRDIFDYIYNLAHFISYHNTISDMVMPDVSKYPISSDVWKLAKLNMLISID